MDLVLKYDKAKLTNVAPEGGTKISYDGNKQIIYTIGFWTKGDL